jgi:hypothetical protein
VRELAHTSSRADEPEGGGLLAGLLPVGVAIVDAGLPQSQQYSNRATNNYLQTTTIPQYIKCCHGEQTAMQNKFPNKTKASLALKYM